MDFGEWDIYLSYPPRRRQKFPYEIFQRLATPVRAFPILLP
jgi:hypothetical protein